MYKLKQFQAAVALKRDSNRSELETALSNVKVNAVQFNPDEATAFELRGQERRAGTAKRIKHEVARTRERPNQRREDA